MVETYRADDERLPELHDCVIEEIQLTDQALMIRFDAVDLPGRESMEYWFPQARTMEMRFQLVKQPVMSRIMLLMHADFGHGLLDSIHKGCFKPLPLSVLLGRHSRRIDERLEYLYHPYEEGALYIYLYSWTMHGDLILRVEADTVQFVWT